MTPLQQSPIRRRTLIFALSTAIAVPNAHSADVVQESRPARVGYLGTGSPEDSSHLFAALKQGVADLRYVEGREIVYEVRWARSDGMRTPALATELLALNLDVVVAPKTFGPKALMEAGATLPIVFSTVSDPIGFGFVRSLAAPGRNLTGLTSAVPDYLSKLLEFLRAVDPKMLRIGVLSGSDSVPLHLAALRETCQSLGIESVVVNAATAADVPGAVLHIARQQVHELIVVPSGILNAERRRVIQEANKHRLLVGAVTRDWVEGGAFISYGANLVDQVRQSATYVDKILRGARPSELPVEQPRKLHCSTNIKTAQALEVPVPK